MIDDVPVNLFRYAVDLHRIGLVDRIEQGGKRIAQIETASTAVADVEHALEFREHRIVVIKFVGLPVEGMSIRGLETALAL